MTYYYYTTMPSAYITNKYICMYYLYYHYYLPWRRITGTQYRFRSTQLLFYAIIGLFFKYSFYIFVFAKAFSIWHDTFLTQNYWLRPCYYMYIILSLLHKVVEKRLLYPCGLFYFHLFILTSIFENPFKQYFI